MTAWQPQDSPERPGTSQTRGQRDGIPLLPQRGAWRGLSPAGRAPWRHTVRACRSTHAHTWMCVRACDPRVPRARVRAAGLGARSGAIVAQRTAAPRPPGSQAGPCRGARWDPAGPLGSAAPQLGATSALPRVPASRKAGARGSRRSGLGLPGCCRGDFPGSGPAAECGGGERGACPGRVPTPDSRPRSSPASKGKAPECR